MEATSDAYDTKEDNENGGAMYEKVEASSDAYDAKDEVENGEPLQKEVAEASSDQIKEETEKRSASNNKADFVDNSRSMPKTGDLPEDDSDGIASNNKAGSVDNSNSMLKIGDLPGDDSDGFDDARPCLYAPTCREPGEYSCKFCTRYSCWDHIVKCLGVQCGQALIFAFCRTNHFRGWTRQPELEAAEGKEATFAWNGAPVEWESAVASRHCSPRQYQ